MSTIKDVAARAGVSFTTVSHVLNGTRRVSDEARARVERAVAEMGYAPSAVARALKTSETFIFGVLVPNITNPFFAELTRGIEDRCRQTDYSVFLCNSDDEPDTQSRYLQTLLERRVDGLLLAAAAGEADVLVKRLATTRVPTVVVERRIPGLATDLVRVDHDAGARLAVAHLVSLGHQAIACLSGPSRFEVARERTAGWVAGLREAGLDIKPEWMLEGDYSSSAGYDMTRSLLEKGEVTAILAGNDLMAFGALRAAAEMGVSVPQQLSVLGFDGIDMGQYVYPALTSVGYPIRELGETAASVLLERLANPAGETREVVLPPQLVMRASTGPVRGK
ncbi:LacI family DNA-binding transcriptional regulator [Aquabacterium sp.]|uniref:LacI family DNA-binding transcriptional regulator n=1 Tax=Aquabacterium sp. TaxID=1872578 RepID=UPI0035AFCE88